MNNIIKNRITFTFLWLPTLAFLIYLEDKNKPIIEAVLSLAFYLLIAYRLHLLNFNRKLFYGFIFVITVPLMMLLIGYIYNLEGISFNLNSNFTIPLIIVTIFLSFFLLYVFLYAVFTKFNRPSQIT